MSDKIASTFSALRSIEYKADTLLSDAKYASPDLTAAYSAIQSAHIAALRKAAVELDAAIQKRIESLVIDASIHDTKQQQTQ